MAHKFGLSTETLTTGDPSWLASKFGITTAQTGTLDVSAFTEADHYPDGFIPDGTLLASDGTNLVPWDSAAVDGTEDLVGVLLDPASVDLTDLTRDVAAAYMWQGRFYTGRLPVAVDATGGPSSTPADHSANPNLTFVA